MRFYLKEPNQAKRTNENQPNKQTKPQQQNQTKSKLTSVPDTVKNISAPYDACTPVDKLRVLYVLGITGCVGRFEKPPRISDT